MKTKDEAPSIFKQFHKMIETQFDAKIKVLHTDNGTEYVNQEIRQYPQENGIAHHTTCVDCPGVAERKNRHLLQVTRYLLIDALVPKVFWGDAVLTAC